MTEKKLVYRCKKQDPSAQKELYETYYIDMKRLVMRYLRNEDDAFDALSRGFFNALSRISQFTYRGEGSLSAWISRIMINESLSKIKNIRKELLLVSQEAATESELAYEEVDVSLLQACIQSLPDGARTVFNLVAIEGYSHTECATLLHISEGTSRSQLVYARNKIKDMLKSSEL